jgi:hypothetical protein
MKIALFAALAACGPSADDTFGANTTLEYVTRVGSPQQESCLQGGTFVLAGPNTSAELTLTKCDYAGVILDAVTPLAVTFATVDVPDPNFDIAEDRSTVNGKVALASSESQISDCDIALTITRTNRYRDGTLVSSLNSWTGTLCGDTEDITREPY